MENFASSQASLAPARDAMAAGSVLREFLSFRLGAEEYGIDILKVQEIRGYEPPTRMANVPDFVKGVVAMDGLPAADRPEICFAGRSNVGKSSLINALTGRKGIARASNTPGRTQEINYFALGPHGYLVDLPGYGFAQAPLPVVRRWQALLKTYLAGRPTLRRAFALIDARHKGRGTRS